MSRIAWAAGGVVAVIVAGVVGVVLLAPQPAPSACAAPGPRTFDLTAATGLNYGTPSGRGGEFLGTRWLQPREWRLARPAFQADLDLIEADHLGSVQRVFVGLDQLMVWDRDTGFVRFDEAGLDDFAQAMRVLDAHGMRAIVVLYDQEETASPGNFRFEALDGRHPAMRRGYLAATAEFLRRFGSLPTVVGWDLFNEAYNSLGVDGGLPRPPADGPVSPGYPDAAVHAWLRDLY